MCLALVVGVFRAVSVCMTLAAAMEIFGEKYGADVVTQTVLFPWGLGVLIGAPIIGKYIIIKIGIQLVFFPSSFIINIISEKTVQKKRKSL